MAIWSGNGIVNSRKLASLSRATGVARKQEEHTKGLAMFSCYWYMCGLLVCGIMVVMLTCLIVDEERVHQTSGHFQGAEVPQVVCRDKETSPGNTG